MAAVAAHFTRIARVSTNTRVKYAQQYMNKPEQPSSPGGDAGNADSSSLCSTMSRLQFDGYEWDVSDDNDHEALARRLTRKITTLQTNGHDNDMNPANQGLNPADDTPAPSSPSRNASRPQILARFDTDARMLMAPSQSARLARQISEEQRQEASLSTEAAPKTVILRIAPVEPKAKATEATNDPVHTTAALEPVQQVPVATPLLTTRRFREGRSSFMSRSSSEPRMSHI
ncbi:hypothetical protein MPSEU_000627800 [Mayamaea pseudoterrestris]|nr:hypothetical protein MPSEU_000627800 [Mayamaea pseudoterrestris]